MKKTILAGLSGGILLLAWFSVVDGLIGFRRNVAMRELADERLVYAFLSEHIRTPGRYVLNPQVLPEHRFPGEEPIYSVQYSGLGHADAGQEMLAGLVIMIAAPLAGAILLANASGRVMSRYLTRFLFFSGIGFVMALFGIIERFGLASYPLADALALAGHDLGAWVVVGLWVAWMIRPVKQKEVDGPVS